MIPEKHCSGNKCVPALKIDWNELPQLGIRLRGDGKRIVLTSCPADPIHPGHLRCFADSCLHGDILIVLVNDDKFLIEKKGYSFMPLEYRLEIVSGIRYIDYVVSWYERDVSQAILALKPDVFTKGGDRKPGNLNQLEVDACHKVDCRLVCGVGGFEKLSSSSELVKEAIKNVIGTRFD